MDVYALVCAVRDTTYINSTRRRRRVNAERERGRGRGKPEDGEEREKEKRNEMGLDERRSKME